VNLGGKGAIVVRNHSKAIEERIAKRRLGYLLQAVILAVICLVYWGPPVFGQASSFCARETARISEVRTVLRGTILSTTRYSRIYDFDVYFSLRSGQETYCIDYETVVLDEIQDLASAEDKDLAISFDAKRNKVTLYTPESRNSKLGLYGQISASRWKVSTIPCTSRIPRRSSPRTQGEAGKMEPAPVRGPVLLGSGESFVYWPRFALTRLLLRRARFLIHDNACRPGEILTCITSCKGDESERL